MTADIVIKATVVLGMALVVRVLLGRRSAGLRHLILAMAFGAVLVLPALSALVPAWRVPLLPPITETFAPFDGHDERTVQVNQSRDVTVTFAPRAGQSMDTLALIWATGAGLVLLWSAIGHLGLARMRRDATVLDDSEWLVLLAESSPVHGLASRVRLFRSARVSTPITWGTFRPTVVLPDVAMTWPRDRQLAVLSHELAHAARADSLTQLLGMLACALYWFNPLVWLAWRGLRMESERACDDLVVSRGTPATEYARHLLDVARLAHAMRLGSMTAIGMARPSYLEGRLLAILDETRSRWNPPGSVRSAAWISLGLVAWPIAAFAPVRGELPALQASAASDSTFERTVEARAGGRLDLDLDTGADVRITGWDQPAVHIKGRLSGTSARESTVEIAPRDGDVLIAIRQSPRRGNSTTSHVLELQVPRRYDVHIRSSGGDLSINDVEGEFSGSTGGGEVTIDRAKGRSSLGTGGGDILVRNSTLDGSVSTGGGAVRFQKVTGNIKGSSGSGPVMRGGPEDGGGPIRMEKAGGDIRLADAPEGADVSTGGGNIRIGAAGGNVRASTGGGDIDIGPVSGSVHAGTGAGDVTVRIARLSADDPAVEISAGVGVVILELPAGLSATLDIETGYTRRTSKPSIDSDWTLAREETTEWDGREGTPRRYVRARGDIGQGGPLIRVRTLNGDVKIVRR